MKAIRTSYIGQTNTRPARWKAVDGDGNKAFVSASIGTAEDAVRALRAEPERGRVMQSLVLVSRPMPRAEHLSARIDCTRCSVLNGSHAVYRVEELAAVAGTRARLCHNCTWKLLASGHIYDCPLCHACHSRGHVAPHCRLSLSFGRLPGAPLYSYDAAPEGAHGCYVRFWLLCKRAVAEGVGEVSTGRAFFPEKTAREALADCRKALHARINLKAGIDTALLGRKVVGQTPRRLMGRRPRSEGCGRIFYDEDRERSGNCGHIGLCPACEGA